MQKRLIRHPNKHLKLIDIDSIIPEGCIEIDLHPIIEDVLYNRDGLTQVQIVKKHGLSMSILYRIWDEMEIRK